MPFTFHPPTRRHCEVCEQAPTDLIPLIDSHQGKASSANNFPIHNWFNFVLGYSPQFPLHILQNLNISAGAFVVDPFIGSGTTGVVCKGLGIRSAGIEANDFFFLASKAKLNWSIDLNQLQRLGGKCIDLFDSRMTEIDSGSSSSKVWKLCAQYREKGLNERYVSDRPLAKLVLLRQAIELVCAKNEEMRTTLLFALYSIILNVSNIKYGPGFGVGKIKVDADVRAVFQQKIERMTNDLKVLQQSPLITGTQSDVYLGDSRELSQYLDPNSVDLMLTSPPYPGDHEYTKHSRLELMFSDLATSKAEFQKIKRRMVRGSTTNVYRDDECGRFIKNNSAIQSITAEITKRLENDNATSGFEKLYTKLVWEYFGGMFLVFQEAERVLKQGGKFALLVSDSHAFKMVHIPTAEILAQVAAEAGLSQNTIQLWQYKNTTSHKYRLQENILMLTK